MIVFLVCEGRLDLFDVSVQAGLSQYELDGHVYPDEGHFPEDSYDAVGTTHLVNNVSIMTHGNLCWFS